MSEQDDLDLATLSNEDLVAQMHDDLYDGLKEEIVEGVTILLKRGWTPYKVLTTALVDGMGRERGAARRGGRGLGGQDHGDLDHARQGLERSLGGGADRGVEGGVRRRDLEREAGAESFGRGGDDQTLDEAGGDQPRAGLRVDDGVEGGEDGFAVGHGQFRFTLLMGEGLSARCRLRRHPCATG